MKKKKKNFKLASDHKKVHISHVKQQLKKKKCINIQFCSKMMYPPLEIVER